MFSHLITALIIGNEFRLSSGLLKWIKIIEFVLSPYENGDIRSDDICIGQPLKDEIFVNAQSIHGGPLICLNDRSFVLSGIASRNTKSIKNRFPGIFLNIFNIS